MRDYNYISEVKRKVNTSVHKKVGSCTLDTDKNIHLHSQICTHTYTHEHQSYINPELKDKLNCQRQMFNNTNLLNIDYTINCTNLNLDGKINQKINTTDKNQLKPENGRQKT